MSILSKKYFRDEKAAFEHLEAIVWADGVFCPHCGMVDRAGKLAGVKGKTGKVRHGLWKCYACRKQFTAKVGTVFESAHIPLHKMLQAVHLICSSKKGFSSHQLHRTLEVDYKSAWFLAHRIREAMRDGTLAPMGGAGGIVEVDETYIGRLDGQPKGQGGASSYKNTVLTLVERGGSARSFHVDSTTLADIIPVVTASVAREASMMSDEASWYRWLDKEYAGHDTVNHGEKEYVRSEFTWDKEGPKTKKIHTNTVEGYYSIFKRGMKGVYQHCSEKHLHRYLAEFDFRYSHRVARGVDDQARAQRALKGISGKRLTYRNPYVTAAE
jgi:transposase-like protein